MTCFYIIAGSRKPAGKYLVQEVDTKSPENLKQLSKPNVLGYIHQEQNLLLSLKNPRKREVMVSFGLR